MGKVTVNWERGIYDEEPHEFVRELLEFLPTMLPEYECAAMLAMSVKMDDGDWQSKQRFEQFCKNNAAREWLGQGVAMATDHALAKWKSGDFTKEASDNGEE